MRLQQKVQASSGYGRTVLNGSIKEGTNISRAEENVPVAREGGLEAGLNGKDRNNGLLRTKIRKRLLLQNSKMYLEDYNVSGEGTSIVVKIGRCSG